MTKDDSRALSIGAFAVAVVALFFAGALVITREDDHGTAAEPAAAETVISVSLGNMVIQPAELNIPPEGATLRITNVDTQVHNLTIPDIGVTTANLEPGQTEEVKVGATPEGTYEMWCSMPGHKEAGMRGLVLVGNSGSMTPMENAMTNEEMDAAMLKVAQQFPAKTEGLGGQRLEPILSPDGFKVYDLTAKIVQWEVTPGNFVEAWTYNGVVPAPEIHVEVGDMVRINLKNDLPNSTSMHLHGIRVPNTMDGVDPYTQAPILPGESFVYEFEAKQRAVGIYHSHHDAQMQIPNGLFGAITIGDFEVPDVLKERGYTQIDKQINMVLNDAGTIGLSLNGKAFPATEPYTLKVGEVMLVNYYNEGLQGHPMHLHQPSGWIIAKDGEEMITPIPGDNIWVAPGERYTVIYKAVDPGVWAWHCHILTHAESSSGMLGMVTALIVEQ